MPRSYAKLAAVVTGSSSGIGREIALALASRAAAERESGDQPRVLVHYRENSSGAAETVDAIKALGVDAKSVRADLLESEQRRSLVDQAWAYLGRPNVWINNAGADVLTGEATELSFLEKLRLLLDTDLIGTVDVTRQVVARLREHDHESLPSITMIGWDQAPHGMEGDAGQMFGPVKAAVMAFANSLAQETAGQIRINTVAPGWIRTSWGEATSDYWNRRAREQSLMGRWGTPEDVAAAVCYVADPANTFCHGQTIEVNGGWSRRHW